MAALTTPRLRLAPLSLTVADAILHGVVPPGANWAPGYPTDGTLIGAALIVTAAAAGEDLGPWTIYQVQLRPDDRVVGGAGFIGHPCLGHVPIGYGSTPEAQAAGVLPEALAALIALANDEGLVATADAAIANVERNAVLEAAGMTRVRTCDGLHFYEA